MAYPIPLNQPSKSAVLQLLNRDNNTNIGFDKIAFGIPAPAPSGYIRNTKMRVSSIPGSGFKNFVDVYYNRISLAAFFITNPLTIDPIGPDTTYDLLAYLNTNFGIHLDQEDVVLETISSSYVNLKAHPNSYTWIGSVNIQLGQAPLPPGTFLDVGTGELFGVDSMTLLDIS